VTIINRLPTKKKSKLTNIKNHEMQFIKLIDSIEQAHQHFQKNAVQAVNQFLTQRNWLIGYYIVEFEQNGEDRAIYGSEVIDSIVKKLKHIKGFSRRNLFLFKSFYLTYPQIVQTVSAQFGLPKFLPNTTPNIDPSILLSKLSFSHFIELLQVESPLKRTFYEAESIKNAWSVRELSRAINTLLFERTGLSEDKMGILTDFSKNQTIVSPKDIIRNPYILEFLELKGENIYSESKFETAIITHIQEFLIELGRGFCFEARQKRITFDNEHYKIDLVFYHRILKCHVLIDLKIGKFSHADAGQMNFYLNYYKKNEMLEHDNPPIGIILCANKNDAFVEYSLGGLEQSIFVSKYMVALPKTEDLKKIIEQNTNNVNQQ
jgi:predicted nuclease of restriction endonuclease-like (RecB) superfamily